MIFCFSSPVFSDCSATNSNNDARCSCSDSSCGGKACSCADAPGSAIPSCGCSTSSNYTIQKEEIKNAISKVAPTGYQLDSITFKKIQKPETSKGCNLECENNDFTRCKLVCR